MRTIARVASAVFRESVRDRVPLSIVAFAVVLMAASYLISQLTAGQDLKIIKDLGLAAITVLGLFIAIFIGIGLVSKEVERRSIYSLLSKPLSRDQFILGKFLGLVTTLAVNVAAMTLAYYAVLFYMNATASVSTRAGWQTPAADPRLLVAVLLVFAELLVVTAVAMFFSTFSTPLPSAFLTLCLWIAGHFNADLRTFETVIDSAPVAWLARVLYYVLPNLAPFDVKAEAVYGIAITPAHVGFTLLYAVVYIGVLLMAAMAIFRRRDFK
ncbi:MAG: ABC transporter permease [Acidobacteria bacterium]|nr:ABC transporter permease [Acidobacteriota bacterium]